MGFLDKIEEGMDKIDEFANASRKGIWRHEVIVDAQTGQKVYELSDGGKTSRKIHVFTEEMADYVVNTLNAKEL